MPKQRKKIKIKINIKIVRKKRKLSCLAITVKQKLIKSKHIFRGWVKVGDTYAAPPDYHCQADPGLKRNKNTKQILKLMF